MSQPLDVLGPLKELEKSDMPYEQLIQQARQYLSAAQAMPHSTHRDTAVRQLRNYINDLDGKTTVAHTAVT